ncbi:hypothetical protein GCM10028799_71860 [Kribbella italica]
MRAGDNLSSGRSASRHPSAVGRHAASAISGRRTGFSAVTAAPSQAATTGDCEGWISGEWGHGKCNNTNYDGRTMKLDVVCDAWWDADVHLEAVVPRYSTMELQDTACPRSCPPAPIGPDPAGPAHSPMVSGPPVGATARTTEAWATDA